MGKNTILLRGTGTREEALANAALYPGHLVELLSTGKIRKHAGGSSPEVMFAVEDELQGKEITDVYAINTLVSYYICTRGMIVYARIADGEVIVIGDKLESNGNGTLRKVDTDTSVSDVQVQSVIATALEAINMSDSSGADPSGFCKVRII